MTLTGGANRWTDFVKEWASDNDTTYGCALSKPECSQAYRAKYGSRKKLTQKKERGMMGAEDKDAPNIQLTIAEEPKKKGRPKKYATEAEAKRAKSLNTMEAKKRRQAEKRALKEAEKMGLEDFDVKPTKKKNPELEMMGAEDKDAPSKEKYLSIIKKNIKKLKEGKAVSKELIEQVKVAYDGNAMTEREMEEAQTLVGLYNAEVRKRKAENKAMGAEDKKGKGYEEEMVGGKKKKGFLDFITKVGTTLGKPFEKEVGINPFTAGFDLGEKVIAPALMKVFPPRGGANGDDDEGQTDNEDDSDDEQNLAQPHFWNGNAWVPVPQLPPAVLEDDEILEGEGLKGGHWTLGEVGHLKRELKNYENIAHHLGQHLSEKGAKDPKDSMGFSHFSREAERIKRLIAKIG